MINTYGKFGDYRFTDDGRAVVFSAIYLWVTYNETMFKVYVRNYSNGDDKYCHLDSGTIRQYTSISKDNARYFIKEINNAHFFEQDCIKIKVGHGFVILTNKQFDVLSDFVLTNIGIDISIPYEPEKFEASKISIETYHLLEREINKMQADKDSLDNEVKTRRAELSSLNEKVRNATKVVIENQTKQSLKLSAFNKDIRTKKGTLLALKAKIKRQNIELHTSDKAIRDSKIELFSMKQAINNLEDSQRYAEAQIGFHEPLYDLSHSTDYKVRLESVRQKQKALIASGKAVYSRGIVSKENARIIKNISRLMLRAFNHESDEIVKNAKWNTSDAAFAKMTSLNGLITNMTKSIGLSIYFEYFELKMEELALAIEYRQKKQEEKDEHRAALEQVKENAKVQLEIDNKRRLLEKEQAHYETALRNISKQLATTKESERETVIERKAKIESAMENIEKQMSDLDFRESNQNAGYVYVISNIGAFGENVFKIGVTRRLEPQDRIDELSTASVPFRFDVHAMIFSENAYKLESALHRAFEDRKINMINKRKEFFAVSLDEIKKVVLENHDKTVEFVDVPDAEQYWASRAMKGQKQISLENFQKGVDI